MDDHTSDPTVRPPSGTPTGWDVDRQRWTHATLRRATIRGVRLYNAGAYHEAHDSFEAEWFNYGRGSTESAFCHGMVQVAAAAYKRYGFDDEAGTRSLVTTARAYLEDVPVDFYGVDVDDVRDRLELASGAPDELDGWRIRLDGRTPTAPDGDFDHPNVFD